MEINIYQVADLVRPAAGPETNFDASRRRASVRRWLSRRGLVPTSAGVDEAGRPLLQWDQEAVMRELARQLPRGAAALSAERRRDAALRGWRSRVSRGGDGGPA